MAVPPSLIFQEQLLCGGKHCKSVLNNCSHDFSGRPKLYCGTAMADSSRREDKRRLIRNTEAKVLRELRDRP